MNVERCTRCNSAIVEDRVGSNRDFRLFEITRYHDNDGFESEVAELCSMCWDELWEWAFDSDLDRSDKADPMPLDIMADSVRRHINELEGVLDALSEAKE